MVDPRALYLKNQQMTNISMSFGGMHHATMDDVLSSPSKPTMDEHIGTGYISVVKRGR